MLSQKISYSNFIWKIQGKIVLKYILNFNSRNNQMVISVVKFFLYFGRIGMELPPLYVIIIFLFYVDLT
jgi:hypothetical protein